MLELMFDYYIYQKVLHLKEDYIVIYISTETNLIHDLK